MLFLKYLREYKGLLFLALLLAIVNQGFSLMDPQIIRLIVDNYATRASEISQQEFLQGVGFLLLGLVGVAFISRLAKNFQEYYVNVITQKVGTQMYADAVEHSFSLPFASFEDRQSGELLGKMQKARLETQKLIASFINVVFLSGVGITTVIVYAFFVHWMIGLAFSLLIPIMAFFIYSISTRIKDAQARIVRESAELAGSTTETIRNVELVKSLGLERQEVKRLNSVNDKILGLEIKKVKIIRMLSFTQGTIVNGVRCCLLFLMLWLLFAAQITIGEFLTLFFYSFFVFGPLAEYATVVTNYQEAKAANNELEKILAIKVKKKSRNVRPLEAIETIALQGVSFRYASSSELSLDKITLSLSQGDSIAFAGLSGSGKTTLIKLILSLYEPTKGDILINGAPLSTWDFDSLRRHIGLVSQETQLFAGTIRENLLFVRPDATDKECLEALHMAAAGSLLHRSGRGLDTKIGEGGLKLSGGEKQRLSIARALLRQPDIIIFDEATSSLDSLTEKEITETIKQISLKNPKLITIMVAHRLSTIAHADTIYVLEKGQIVQTGTHEKLIKKSGLYSSLWKQQIGEMPSTPLVVR